MIKTGKYYFSKILSVLLLLSFCKVECENILELKNNKSQNYIGKYLEILNDQNGSYSIGEVLNNKNFINANSDVPNLQVTSFVHWIKFTAVNLSDKKEFIVQLALATIDYVDFYSVYDDGRIDSVSTGDCRSFNNRPYGRPDFAFKIILKKNEKVKIFFKVSGGEQIQTPVNIGEETLMLKSFINEDSLMGIYFGIILVMFLYNSFIYFSTRDKSYLFYVVYIIIVGITQLNFMGYTAAYLWPNSTYISNMAVYILSSITAISSIEFMKRFLSTKEKTPTLHKYFNVFYFIYYLAMVLAFCKKFNWSYQIIQINATMAASYILLVAWQISKQGYRPARFFLAAWSTFLIGVCVFVFKDLGILPYNKITYYTMPVGSAFEVILLSLALADRINILRKEKEDSQHKNLELLLENEKIIKDQNIKLEVMVKDRTFELEQTNKNLKEAEAILVSAEKMASLGQLTAGISHEINNPINFVVANIKPLRKDIEEILSVLSKYKEVKDSKNIDEKLREIEELKKKLDVNYLEEEINLLLSGIDEGAKRTSDIVKGLKNFSRTDESELIKVDVQEGIESTLTLLNNNITNAKIKVVRDFSPLPKIDCYPSKLNQVYMNLLSNSIQAIEKRNDKSFEGLISISTAIINKNLIVKISDNGVGIPPANISKVFDPFFTTKEVGKGTGLGLSIVYGIIKSHKGTIEVESQENKNTTFVITIPV